MRAEIILCVKMNVRKCEGEGVYPNFCFGASLKHKTYLWRRAFQLYEGDNVGHTIAPLASKRRGGQEMVMGIAWPMKA